MDGPMTSCSVRRRASGARSRPLRSGRVSQPPRSVGHVSADPAPVCAIVKSIRARPDLATNRRGSHHFGHGQCASYSKDFQTQRLAKKFPLVGQCILQSATAAYSLIGATYYQWGVAASPDLARSILAVRRPRKKKKKKKKKTNAFNEGFILSPPPIERPRPRCRLSTLRQQSR